MITFPTLPGVDINLYLLIFLCLGTGILSGFTGVGGAFIMMPALVALGFPANFAVGTSLAWVLGNSIIGAFSHRKLGNVDMKLGLVTIAAALGGVEAGVRIVDWAKSHGLADEVILSISIVMLLSVGSYSLLESTTKKKALDQRLERGVSSQPDTNGSISLPQKLQKAPLPPRIHFSQSGITISLWIVLAVGFFIGLMIGILGVGGGFILVPALIYVIGLPSFMAVGTSLFQMIFSSAYGCIRHTMDGNVIIFASVIMLLASSFGVQFGASVTRYVHGVSVRFVLGATIILAGIGTLLKLLSILSDEPVAWLDVSSLAVIFGGIGLAVIMILALFFMGIRYHRGKPVAAWVRSLVARDK